MENLSMLFRRIPAALSRSRAAARTGIGGLPVALTLSAVLALLFAWSGCGQVECGKGTVEVDGVCQVANRLECAAGFKAQGDKCVPEDEWVTHYCGENAAYDKASGTCVGIGGGEQTGCTERCPAVSGSKICLQGQVFHAPALLAYHAGDKQLADIQDSIVTTIDDGAIIKIFDPLDFVTNPSSSVPLAQTDVGPDGCFVAKDVSIPFSNLFVVGVDDKTAGGTTWVLAGLGVKPTVGVNSEDLLTPAVTQTLAAQWDSAGTPPYNFYKDGSMFAMFLDKFTKKGVEGVVPTFDGKPPIKSGDHWTFEGTDMDVFYMAADPSDPTKIVDTSASATTKTGIAIIRKMTVKNLHGEKAGCTINGGESKLGGSSPESLFFSIFDVEGC
jgi:hypothetical protein